MRWNRGARDGLGLNLQRLVHEDMMRAFEDYPAQRTTRLPVSGVLSEEPPTNTP
jgi:uncharacterized protein YijF (DUF1287 family)